MNKDKDLERFYQDVTHMNNSNDDLSCAGKTIVLFRVALECGAAELGMAGVPPVIKIDVRNTRDHEWRGGR